MPTDQIKISHIDNSGAIQSNEEHQRGVAQMAERFAAEFGMGDCGRLMGLLHDTSIAFLAKIHFFTQFAKF